MSDRSVNLVDDVKEARLLGSRSIETVSGLTAGFITTLISHPLDFLKLRLQLDTTSKTQLESFRQIRNKLLLDSSANGVVQRSQLIRNIYRGVGPNLLGSTTAWGLYFSFYGEYKSLLTASTQPAQSLGSSQYLMCAFAAGWSTSIFTNPIWVIKTRMISTSRASPGAYLSIKDGVLQIYKKEGVSGFYRGLSPALLSVSQGALQFSIYDTLKAHLSGPSVHLNTSQYLYASAVSKMISTVVFYPLQVVRSRLQIKHGRYGMVYAAKEVWTREGLFGFYKGVFANLIRVVPATCITFAVSLSRHKPLGFLGLIEMNGDVFLSVITGKVDVASPIEGEVINKIMDVEFHCLTRDTWDFLELNANGFPLDADSESQPGGYPPKYEQHPCYELRKLLTDGSFFYSSDFDLTSTLQTRGIDTKNSLSRDRFHLDYMWNAFMMEEVIKFRNNLDDLPKKVLDENRFLTTVIRGFAETMRASVGGRKSKLTIISKQSWKRAGTRFNVRGVDDDGNVANFVETELIYDDEHHVFAYTQIRGSIPVFWEQDTALISPKVQITRSFEATQPVFEKHFENLNGKYGPVNIVNLLSSTKSSEVELNREYKHHFMALDEKKPDSVYFTDFDFHQETAKTYAHAARILSDIQLSLDRFGFYCYNKATKEILLEQQGVFRVNCLDCLDRTNVVQQVISMAALDEFVKAFRKGDIYDLNNKHSSLWADHGDQISQIYTGTNALKSSFSRSGKMGFAGAFSDATKSISRIYINNFVDKGKQAVTDTLLGKNSNQLPVLIFDPITEYVNEESKKYERKFVSHEDITIYVGSYNVAGNTISGDLSSWLFPRKIGGSSFSPDIVIVGFQEVIELNASNILKNDATPSQYWQSVIERQLNDAGSNKYLLLRAEYMSSVLLLLYVKADVVSKITQVEGKSKKTGLGGMTANKGSVAIRFDYGSTSFCFFNSHLAAGTTNIEERYNDFVTSWNAIRFSRNRQIKHHDNIVWLGDLNYRISKPNEEVRSLLDSNELATLQDYDQLRIELKRRAEMRGFKEMPIKFIPTYKFDKGTSDYDSSEKQRVPSWTDRILYRGATLTQLAYNAIVELVYSDHKPIYGVFTSNVKLVDEKTKMEIVKKLYLQYKSSAMASKGAVIELNEADDDDTVDAKSTVSMSNWSMTSAPTLIDLSSESGGAEGPPLPQRTSAHSSSQENTLTTPQRRRVPPPYDADKSLSMLVPGLSSSFQTSLKPNTAPNASPNYSLEAMRPTRSSTSSPAPATSAPPPPPPPRKAVSSDPAPQQHAEKVTPIVPSKPKALVGTPTEEIADKWAPMVPNRKSSSSSSTYDLVVFFRVDEARLTGVATSSSSSSDKPSTSSSDSTTFLAFLGAGFLEKNEDAFAGAAPVGSGLAVAVENTLEAALNLDAEPPKTLLNSGSFGSSGLAAATGFGVSFLTAVFFLAGDLGPSAFGLLLLFLLAWLPTLIDSRFSLSSNRNCSHSFKNTSKSSFQRSFALLLNRSFSSASFSSLCLSNRSRQLGDLQSIVIKLLDVTFHPELVRTDSSDRTFPSFEPRNHVNHLVTIHQTPDVLDNVDRVEGWNLSTPSRSNTF
ncbi:hypothetical protein OGAPHI_005241 [Ogataea philodendri]|uniref:phosphoinositide 5-phosphatase n=1 Tax=Ogataea philodendri TaxID=1378263 RepID=A0A9P8P1J8_9ASCO|nr:uncharacterized protein OGAPHI_005241 [Ogataea philodendri]KAH3663838.1 hypothetical protein OGAPHI_005241 [Ogataea philodendri]